MKELTMAVRITEQEDGRFKIDMKDPEGGAWEYFANEKTLEAAASAVEDEIQYQWDQDGSSFVVDNTICSSCEKSNHGLCVTRSCACPSAGVRQHRARPVGTTR